VAATATSAAAAFARCSSFGSRSFLLSRASIQPSWGRVAIRSAGGCQIRSEDNREECESGESRADDHAEHEVVRHFGGDEMRRERREVRVRERMSERECTLE
jgi:hypothetical protein